MVWFFQFLSCLCCRFSLFLQSQRDLKLIWESDFAQNKFLIWGHRYFRQLWRYLDGASGSCGRFKSFGLRISKLWEILLFIWDLPCFCSIGQIDLWLKLFLHGWPRFLFFSLFSLCSKILEILKVRLLCILCPETWYWSIATSLVFFGNFTLLFDLARSTISDSNKCLLECTFRLLNLNF